MTDSILPSKQTVTGPTRSAGSGVTCLASWNVDLVVRIDAPLAAGQTVFADDCFRSPGGKGSNAAIAAARQGATVQVLAAVGDDDFGAMGLQLWRDEGIDVGAVRRLANQSSGVAMIVVYPDGDNSIVVASGANRYLSVEQVRAAGGRLAASGLVMASAEVPLDSVTEAFRLARTGKALTLLNPAPACMLPSELLAHTDILTPNRHELALLAGAGGESVEQQALTLLATVSRAVIVTLGDQGCCVVERNQPALWIPAVSARVVDAVGAGDAFNGALAAALARGESLAEAARWANCAAALSTEAPGAVRGLARLEQVAERLASGA